LKLSSKKTFLIAIAAALVAGGIYVAYKANTFKRSSATTTTQAIVESVTNSKGDNDGLKDWEEALWGTDPHNPDTDGDGTPDGEEVKEGRNPLVANTAKKGLSPNDFTASTTVSSALADSSATTTELTKTDMFARVFFANYMQLKSQGVTIDQNAENQIIQQTMADPSLQAPAIKTFSIRDIKANGGTDETSIHAYGNALGTALRTNSPKKAYTNEGDLFNQALKDNSPDELSGMDLIITSYNNLLQAYLKIKVPSDATSLHLNLLNSTNRVYEDIKAMRNVFTDGVLAYQRVGDFPKDTVLMIKAISDFKAYFANHAVTFTNTENGYGFLNTPDEAAQNLNNK
jgi:hypothetical protein